MVVNGIVLDRYRCDGVARLVDAAKHIVVEEHRGDVVCGLLFVVEVTDGHEDMGIVEDDVVDIEVTCPLESALTAIPVRTVYSVFMA